MRAGPGTAVCRNEDVPLLTGIARYLPDLRFGQLHAAFVRSTVASARITDVRTGAALAAPGVVTVVTAPDLSLGRIRAHLSGVLSAVFDRPPLADGVVRMVGEAIAVVVAETAGAAVDAAGLVEVSYEALPVVVDPEAALLDGCFVLFPEHGSNRAHQVSVGGGGDVLAGAEIVVQGRFVNQRVSAAPMETNGALALPGDHGRGITVWASTQRVHQLRDELALVLDLDTSDVRVVTPQVGGGFGAKYDAAPEAAVVAALAHRLQRPVMWHETRTESMVSLFHGRGQVQYVELGLRRDGTFAGIRVRLIGDAGAYPMIGALIPSATLRMLPGPYGIASVEGHAVAAATNTTPMGAYRGAGRPEACALLERIIDIAAVELGVDPVELRRRNLLASDAFPFTTATGMIYDVGDYQRTLDAALELIGYEARRRDQAERRSDGRVKQLGIGVVMWLDATPLNRPGEYAAVDISALPDGGVDVAVRAGTMDQGQGHATTWGLILSGILGVPVDSVRLVRSDTASVPKGEGTGSARSLQVTGSSVNRAGHQLLAQARSVAAHLLEAAPDDIVVTSDGDLAVVGTPSRSVSWAEVAAAASEPGSLPPEIAARLAATGLGAESDEDNAGPTFPSGTHAAVVEVDTETGSVEVLHFVAVDDCGRVINPVTFAGQQHGGIAQGMAQALYEGIAYDQAGNPLTATFADYGIPSAADLPSLDVHTIETPTSRNPLGAKGIGQGGAVGATPAVQNAVIDALSHLGVRHIDPPLTAERVWHAIVTAAPPQPITTAERTP
ncbi:MAG TPA: xanthine dehydrogenase family protein molybdopterin-binding subunit [Acidimicrobiales bacterium]